jgi:hypothetical protein
MESALKINKLTGSSGWELWQLRMQSILVEKGYWFVIGDNYMEVDDGTILNEVITEKRDKALAYIQLYLGDGSLLQIRQMTNPKEL